MNTDLLRREEEPFDEWAIRLLDALKETERALEEERHRATVALDGWTRSAGEAASYRRGAELARAKQPSIQTESAFIRQNNEVRKLIEARVKGRPGPDWSLVCTLAGVLDIEVPEWRAGQD